VPATWATITLGRRGVGLSVAGLGAVLGDVASATVPPELAKAAVRAALPFADGSCPTYEKAKAVVAAAAADWPPAASCRLPAAHRDQGYPKSETESGPIVRSRSSSNWSSSCNCRNLTRSIPDMAREHHVEAQHQGEEASAGP
jgi:hypothetical protein